MRGRGEGPVPLSRDPDFRLWFVGFGHKPALAVQRRTLPSGFCRVLPYCGGMAKSGRLELRITSELLARVDAEAERLGQTRTKFVERAVERALGPVVGGVSAGERLAGGGSAASRAPVESSAMARQRAMNRAKGL
jgi:hypothetical protein